MVEAEESSLAESLFNLCLGAGLIFTKKVALAAKKAGTPKTRQVKISACSEPSRGREGTTDVIVYPEVCCATVVCVVYVEARSSLDKMRFSIFFLWLVAAVRVLSVLLYVFFRYWKRSRVVYARFLS